MLNMLGMNDVLAIILIAVGLVGGLAGGYFVCVGMYVSKRSKAEKSAAKIMEEAYSEAKFVKKQANLEAKELVLKEQEQGKEQLLAKKLELERREDKIARNEEDTQKKLHEAEILRANLAREKETSERHIKEAEEIKKEATEKLSKLAGITKEQAKREIINLVETEAKKEAAIKVREIEDEIKETADKKAKDIVSLAIQRCAVDHTSEATVSVVTLPNDEVKGKIIGREGRNVRALEAALGVDLIIDDTPEAITVSAFDPIRREIAKISLEKLILDGRIHPARIEEIVEKVRKDIDTTIKESGELAVLESGIVGVHPEIVKTLGRLKYRTSYGQNVLKHSLEVCFLAGLLASEIGANVDVAKRGGLLHDLGKAVDFEKDGTHVSLGMDIAKKFKENDAVIHCIEAHHGDAPYRSVEAILVQVADAISSSRPGARRESLENYIKRLEQLEGIANKFKGVEKSFAIQAGREVRIIVKPDEVDDNSAVLMAKEIAKKIEAEMEYPGQIKVNVIRETRTSEYAK